MAHMPIAAAKTNTLSVTDCQLVIDGCLLAGVPAAAPPSALQRFIHEAPGHVLAEGLQRVHYQFGFSWLYVHVPRLAAGCFPRFCGSLHFFGSPIL